jgi:glycosyltransferase involved in cell wall biosynthesis
VPGIAWRLIQETLAWQPDVVHCFKPKAYSGLVMWWLWQFKRRQLRLVLDTDDWEGRGGWNELAPYTAKQKRFFAWQEQWGMRHCHVLTVASRALQSLAWSQGIHPRQVLYLPNGPGIGVRSVTVDEPRLAALSGRPTLLLYSRLFEFDPRRLVTILKGVRAVVPDLALLAVGSGLYEADSTQFRRDLAASGLEDMIVDVGWVATEKLAALLAMADVGIYLMDDTLLNRTKCPVKLADMLSVGVPVVAEAVGQVTEYVIESQTGRLRPSGDVAGLTADIIHLLRDEKERERLAAGGKAHIAAQFNWQRLSQRLELAYVGEEV